MFTTPEQPWAPRPLNNALFSWPGVGGGLLRLPHDLHTTPPTPFAVIGRCRFRGQRPPSSRAPGAPKLADVASPPRQAPWQSKHHTTLNCRLTSSANYVYSGPLQSDGVLGTAAACSSSPRCTEDVTGAACTITFTEPLSGVEKKTQVERLVG